MDANLADVFEAVAAAVPERVAVRHRGRSWSYRALDARADRVAGALHAAGLGAHERGDLPPHRSHQDHVAVLLHNGPEYLEVLLGAFKARVAPFGVNTRYVEEELRHVLVTGGARALVVDGRFAERLAPVIEDLDGLETVIQVGDGPLLAGAMGYEDLLDAAPPPPALPRSPDDLYLLCTGGTTGRPKAVMWRQADILMAALGGFDPSAGREASSIDELVDAAVHSGAGRLLLTSPLMHGSGQWSALSTLFKGATLVVPDHPDHLDADEIWDTVVDEEVDVLSVVGDAVVRPLLDALERRGPITTVLAVASGGAPLHPDRKQRLLALLPTAVLVDSVGASETGTHLSALTSTTTSAGHATAEIPEAFEPGPGTVVLSADRSRAATPGEPGIGWLARRGRVALGYLGDTEATATTFPVIDGVRHAMAGDRARVRADGQVQLLGRDASTINTGGEKVFAEEVEQALAHHPDVVDVVVAGRPSPDWGEEVVAIVRLRPGSRTDDRALEATAATHLARYKLPKAYLFVDRLPRSAAGKPDHRWARRLVTTGGG